MLQIIDSCYGVEIASIDWTLVWTFISTVMVALGVIFGLWQLRAIKNSSILQAYAKISDILQTKEVIKARGVLLNDNRRRRLSQKKLTKYIEVVSRSYDMAGKMLRRSGLGITMLAEDWQRSIRLCWCQCEGLIMEYREKRGEDFWKDFQLLYFAAKKYYDNHPELHKVIK